MNKLIINAGDFGYSRGINHAIIDVHQEGILTSASIMANTPGFEHAVKLAAANPTLGIGVHLVLTFGKPLSTKVPSLVDENGRFYRPALYRIGDAIADLDELYQEWNAQIQKVIEAGIQPTHLDVHQNAQLFNYHHLEVFLELAHQYDLPVRNNFALDHLSPPRTAYFEPAFDGVSALMEAEREAYLGELYQKIKENDSTEILCHPGYIDEFLLTHSSFSEPRVFQVNILTNSPFADKIRADKDIKLSTFADL